MRDAKQSKGIFVLEDFGKLIPAVTGAAFVTSLFSDLGYFMALRIPLSQVPTSLSDHIRSAINWLPISVLLILLIGWIAIRTQPLFSEVGLLVPKQMKVKVNRKKTIVGLLVAAVLVFVLAVLILRQESPNTLASFFCLMGLWLLYYSVLQLFTNFSELHQRDRFLVYIVPLIAIFCFAIGMVFARTDTQLDQRFGSVITKEKSEMFMRVQILRQYEKAVLVKTHDDSLIFISRDEILRVEFPFDGRKKKSGLEAMDAFTIL